MDYAITKTDDKQMFLFYLYNTMSDPILYTRKDFVYIRKNLV